MSCGAAFAEVARMSSSTASRFGIVAAWPVAYDVVMSSPASAMFVARYVSRRWVVVDRLTNNR